MNWRKSKDEISRRIAEVYSSTAYLYDKEAGHGIDSEAENQFYKEDFFNAVKIADADIAKTKTLEIGSGTGLFTQLLKSWGFPVTGLEAAQAMIKAGRCENRFEDVTIVQENVESSDAFNENSFDLIACRQVVCHFYDPLNAFKNWSRWLRPNGRAVIIEGFWRRSGWAGEWAEFPDSLPLACPQSWASIAYLLELAGFEIESCNLMCKVNHYDKTRAGENEKATERFIIVARNNKTAN